MNISPLKAELLVFLMSAALCEVSLLLHNNEKPSSPNNNVLLLFYSSTQYLIALPLHSCRLWIFLTMVLEVRFFQQVIIYVSLYSGSVGCQHEVCKALVQIAQLFTANIVGQTLILLILCVCVQQLFHPCLFVINDYYCRNRCK